MGFAPDYGLKLKSLGVRDDFEMKILPFELHNLGFNARKGLVCSTVNVELCGEPHALTLDFDMEQLRELIALLPIQLSLQIREAVHNNPSRPFHFKFPVPIPLIIRARFGEVQKTDREDYLPMQVTSVKACPDEPDERPGTNLTANPTTVHLADSVTIVRLQQRIQVPLGEKSDVIAAFERAWPTLRWEDLDTEPVYGRFTTRGYVADVAINFREDCYGAAIDAVPEGHLFDEAFFTEIEQLCEANGWTLIFTYSAEDRYL
jgi:hypothetical protein